MVQALLLDGFKLKVHRETKESHGYALIVAGDGDKLKETAAMPELPHLDFGFRAAVPKQATILGTSSLESLTQFLVPFVSEGTTPSPVVNRTGLSGTYTYALTFKLPGPGPRGGGGGDLREAIASALQDQLGLRLQPTNLPEEIVVIDHAEKPSEN